MNSAFRLLLFAVPAILPCVAAAGDPTVLSAERVKPAAVMVADLRGESPGIFSYSSWKDAVNPSVNGVNVLGGKGAQGDGGFGGNLTPAVDLDGVVLIDVALGVGPLNEVPVATVALCDADGTQVSARIQVGQIVPQQPVWFQLPVSEFRTVSGYEGKTPGMDWSSVVQWHLQGDWTTKRPYHMVFIAVRARR